MIKFEKKNDMNRIFTLVALLTFTVLNISCNKEKDEEAPEINNMNIDDSNEEVYVPAGSGFEISAVISDNKELSQMKLDIHSNFDGHGHKNNLVEFQMIEIYDLEGNTFNYNEVIEVPENIIAGPYHVGLFVVDKEGNEGLEEVMNLIVTRPDAPQVNFSAPDFNTSPSYSSGDTLKLYGMVTDNGHLVEIVVSLKEINGNSEVFSQDFDLTTEPQGWDMQVDGNLNIPIVSGFTSGKYSLLIRAEDNLGNITLHRETLNLTE